MTEPSPPLPPAPGSSSQRILSLDQFRGYTVVGMFLVNYLSSFKGNSAVPQILLHSHDYCSYADTIMPQFLFAVGFSFRLTFGRRAKRQGLAAAYGHMVRRILGLALIAIVVYGSSRSVDSWQQFVDLGWWEGLKQALGPNLKREWYQTLMHIAVTSLWLLPVIRAGAGVRFLWMLASAVAHIWLSYKFNFVWVNSSPNGIDGGPLGFLTWCIPAMFGTFACDVVAGSAGQPNLRKLVRWGVGLMVIAWIVSCGTRMYDVPTDRIEELAGRKLAEDPVFPPVEKVKAHFQKPLKDLLVEPPFVPPPPTLENYKPQDAEAAGSAGPHKYRQWNYWMMSQRGGTFAYPTFSAGVSLLVYVLFYLACDVGTFRSKFFNAFGVNALAAYILHGMVGSAVQPFVPKDAAWWYVYGSVALFFAINYIIIRHLEKQNIYLKL